MLEFAVRWLYPLRKIPYAPLLLDTLLKSYNFLFNHKLLDYIDEIEKEALSWKGVYTKLHRYGGLEFCINGKEIGHIHSNGLLDITFTKNLKTDLKKKYEIHDHHVFQDSGWISYHIKMGKDISTAKELLRISYLRISKNELIN